MPWISEARNIFDEVVVLIDQRRVTPGTLARAEKVTGKVVQSNREAWYDPDRFSMLAGCNSDWIFILEYDEQLSAEWQQEEWRRILETGDFTHFWIPRRWTLPGGRYINDNPWWPDFQLRLFQNRLEGTVFPSKLHERIQVPGPGGTFRNLAIYHHVLWLCSRATRVDRVRYYEQLRPGGGLGHYYLYEDYAPAEALLPAPASVDIDSEIITMDRLSPEEICLISLNVSNVPAEVPASQILLLDAEITNGTMKPVRSVANFPVHMCYHWIYERTRKITVFDGLRSELFPGVPPRETIRCRMTVLTPNQPGDYILETTVVQEGVCWFESVRPEILQRYPIRVARS